MLKKALVSLVALGSLASGASAEVLFDNLSDATGDSLYFAPPSQPVAQAFATDDHAYRLTSVDVGLVQSTSQVSPVFAIYDNSGVEASGTSNGPETGAPGVLVGMLQSPSSFSDGPNIFGGNGILLDPNAHYWVVAQGGFGHWEDTGIASGLGVGYLPYAAVHFHEGWIYLDPMIMRVSAQVVPEPTPGTYGALALLAGMYIGLRRRR
jgi:MYXO-CTERM domain-containing protein